jgi:hypothetical protein
MLKLISLNLETQADTKFHVCVQYSTAQHVQSQAEGNGANRAGRHRVSVAKYTVLPSFISIATLVCDIQLLIQGLLPMHNSATDSYHICRNIISNYAHALLFMHY